MLRTTLFASVCWGFVKLTIIYLFIYIFTVFLYIYIFIVRSSKQKLNICNLKGFFLLSFEIISIQ